MSGKGDSQRPQDISEEEMQARWLAAFNRCGLVDPDISDIPEGEEPQVECDTRVTIFPKGKF